jgi:hypothetical protein
MPVIVKRYTWCPKAVVDNVFVLTASNEIVSGVVEFGL